MALISLSTPSTGGMLVGTGAGRGTGTSANCCKFASAVSWLSPNCQSLCCKTM